MQKSRDFYIIVRGVVSCPGAVITSIRVNHLQISQRLAFWFCVATGRAKASGSSSGLPPVTLCTAFLPSQALL